MGIISSSNAVIDPLTMMITSVHTVITLDTARQMINLSQLVEQLTNGGSTYDLAMT